MKTARLAVTAAIVVLALVVTFVSAADGWPVEGAWPFSSSDDREQVEIGESVSKAGVHVTLESVSATSSETSLTFVVRSLGALDGSLADAIPGLGREIKVEGIVDAAPRLGNRSRPDGSVELTVILGALRGETQFGIVTLPGFFLTNWEGESVDIKDEFTFAIDASALGSDPVDEDIVIDSAFEATSGSRVEVGTIHASSSGLTMTFELDSGLMPVGYPARLITPDGKWHPGYTRAPPAGERASIIEFPDADYSAGSRIVFGPFARSVSGPFEITVDLNRVTGASPRGQRFEILGDTIEAATLTDTKDGFEILLRNVTNESPSVAHDGSGEATARDDTGTEYRVTSYGFTFQDGPEGEAVPETLTVRMAGELNPDAKTVTLTVTSLSKLEAGPEFTLPPLED